MDNSPVRLASNISIMESFLVLLKGLIMITSAAYTAIVIIKKVHHVVNNKENKEINNTYTALDTALFSLVLAIVFVSSLIVLYIFKDHALFIFKHVLGGIGIMNKPKQINVAVPVFHVSVIWWVNIWILLVCLFAIVTKITGSIDWLLFMF